MKLPKFTLRGFKAPREVMDLALGALEREVMDVVWDKGEISVRDTWTLLGETAAYTTVMTTLDRLYRKRLLKRRKDERAFLYTATLTREEFAHAVTKDVVHGLLTQQPATEPEPLLACIIDAVTEHDKHLLDELERLVRAKKQQAQKRKSGL